MHAGIAEVMSLVTNLGSGEEAGKEELSGPTDPIRVVMSHTINPVARTVGFTVELLNRMTADVKSLVLRSVLDSKKTIMLIPIFAPVGALACWAYVVYYHLPGACLLSLKLCLFHSCKNHTVQCSLQ